MHQRPMIFPNWNQVLATSALIPSLKAAYAREIPTFLRDCKSGHEATAVEFAKRYRAWREQRVRAAEAALPREASRWFYPEGKRVTDQPPGASPAQPDQNPDSGCARLWIIPEF